MENICQASASRILIEFLGISIAQLCNTREEETQQNQTISEVN